MVAFCLGDRGPSVVPSCWEGMSIGGSGGGGLVATGDTGFFFSSCCCSLIGSDGNTGCACFCWSVTEGRNL